MNAVIYCRVSTKEQVQNYSLPTQKKACIEYCQRNGFEVNQIFVDEGESAKTTDRTEFQKLLAYCRQNKGKVQYVVVYAVNRFSRNQYDHYAIKALLSGLGVSLRSVTEAIDDSSTGILLEGFMATLAHWDNKQKAERTIVGMKSAIQSGNWPFKAPLGYKQVKGQDGRSVPIIDRERGPLVAKAFDLYSTGIYSARSVLKMVTDLGLCTNKGNKVSLQTFTFTLRNPFYSGMLFVKGWSQEQKGNFEALVSQETFNKVQALLSGKKVSLAPYMRNNPDFPLRLFTLCGNCGKPLTGSWNKGRTKRYPYYHCPNLECRKVYVPKEKFENQFLEYINKYRPNTTYLKLFKKIVLDVWKDKAKQYQETKKTFEGKLQKLSEDKQKLINTFIYLQAIDKKTYDEQVDKLNEQIASAELDLNDNWVQELNAEAALNFAEYVLLNPGRLWKEFDLSQKQRLQRVLFPERISYLNGTFGTTKAPIIYSLFETNQTEKSRLASPTGFEPVSLP